MRRWPAGTATWWGSPDLSTRTPKSCREGCSSARPSPARWQTIRRFSSWMNPSVRATRSLMQELLLRVWEQTHKTVLFVTHDIEEAILLADRIYVMTARPGRIKHEVRVPLPRPRTVAVLDSDGFIRLRREVYQSIREESLKVLVTTEDEG